MNLSYDPFDCSQTHAIEAVARRFQREAPVARVGGGFVLVTRYGDVRTVLAENDIFSNAGGFRRTGTHVPMEDISLGELDAPHHAPLRKLAMGAVTSPRAVDALRGFVRETARNLLGKILERGEGDLIEDFSLKLTNRAISKMLGSPLEQSDWLAEQAETIMGSTLLSLNRTERGVGFAGAFPEFTAFLDELIRARQGDSHEEDAISRILSNAVEVHGRTPELVTRQLLIQLLLGGTATTRDSIGSMCLRMIDNPELHARLAQERSLVPAAVEEGLRLDPPVLFVMRTVARPTRLRDVELLEGERVIASTSSANRDEDVYEHPHEFRVDRVTPAPHLAFGYASHFCVGNMVARMESQVALDAFLDLVRPGTLQLKPGFRPSYQNVPSLLGHARIDVELM
jgi:cytochrome P450